MINIFKRKYEPLSYDMKRVIREWKFEENLDFKILCRYRKGILEIITSEPGIIIGFRGKTINNLEEKLSGIDGFKKCKITHIKDYV